MQIALSILKRAKQQRIKFWNMKSQKISIRLLFSIQIFMSINSDGSFWFIYRLLCFLAANRKSWQLICKASLVECLIHRLQGNGYCGKWVVWGIEIVRMKWFASCKLFVQRWKGFLVILWSLSIFKLVIVPYA